jgi:hypothetical protein
VDQQILTQLVTASVALLAGLGGASITAFINRRNTMDTLAAARLTSEDQWTRVQAQEHTAWLRGQKQEAYTEFLTITLGVYNQVHEKGIKPDADVPKADGLGQKLARLRLVATDDINEIATELATCTIEAIVYLTQRPVAGNGEQTWATEKEVLRNYKHFSDQLEEFIGAARLDFGVDLLPSKGKTVPELQGDRGDEMVTTPGGPGSSRPRGPE